MHWYNKVVCSEGLFLRPQLFQQQERYLEQYAHRRAAPAGPFFWGLAGFEVDLHALTMGKVGLSHAAGLFTDGTPFEVPMDGPLPAPLAVTQLHDGEVISLAIQIRKPDSEETTFLPGADRTASLARFGVFDAEVRDANSIGQGPKPVQLSQLRLHVMPQKEALGGWLSLPFARIESVRADGSVRLDESFIPAVCGIGGSGQLMKSLSALYDLCHKRVETLAERLSASDGRAQESAEVADFLLLQILNRYDALLAHVMLGLHTPPEQVYLLLRGLSAELATYVSPDTRRAPAHAPYAHGDLNRSFDALIASLRAMLHEVLVRSARLIPLQEKANNLRFADVTPAELESFSNLVLAVAADMPPGQLAVDFPRQCKVGPNDRLSELIRSHIPGIPLQLLPVPPRQIPFNAGFLYFQLEPHGVLWQSLLAVGGIGLHLGNIFPGLRLQLWGVSKK